MHSIRGRGHILQRRRTADNLRHGWDGHGPTPQKRNSQLFSWDDEFWKKSAQAQHSLASSASTFEEVESLCMSKSSSDSMYSSQRQWDKFGSGGPFKGTLPSRRLISRQSSTTSTSTSRSSGLMGDAAGGEASLDFDPDRCQFIADTLLESMDLLGAQGSLDSADRYYLENIFKRVLEWNNVMPVPKSKTASIDSVQVADSKCSKKVLAKQARHRDANSPRSHAALRDKLLKLKHHEKVSSSAQPLQQTDSRVSQQSSNHHARRRRDLILPDEDAAEIDSRKHSHSLQSAGQSYGIKRQTSHSSRDTSTSSKVFSDNSTSRYSCVSSMSSFSMDNGSPRGSPKGTTETQQTPHHPNLATLLPQYSIPHTGSFESTATHSDHFLLSQTCATNHAERVLMGLGFGATEGFLPERFLKDWYSKISKAQTESAVNAELKRQESVNNPSVNVDVNNQRYSQDLKDSSSCRRPHEASTDLPTAHDKCTKLERLKEYIAAYTNNISSTDEEKEQTTRQSLFSRQKSLPLSLEALSKLEGQPRHSGMDPFDKESQLQMFISAHQPNNRKNANFEYSRNGRQSEWDTRCSSVSLHTDSREHPSKKTTQRNLQTHIEETIGSLQQIIQRQLINSDLSDTHEDTHANLGIRKYNSQQYFQANKHIDGTNRRSLRDISNGNSCIARAGRSPTRQVAVDVCDTVCKADRSDNKQQNKTEEDMHKRASTKTHIGKEKNVPDICQRTPCKRDSLLSKDSEEVAEIMQNQPNREQKCSSAYQHHSKVNGGQGRPLKSALKHVEPAMVSIVLEDTDQGEGSCSADIVSVSPEGIHLVIPLSACSSSSLSPIPQSPVTVIEVGLDNQQDSLDTEGTYSSKDTDDDNSTHPTMFYCGEYSAMKPNHDRRRSLLSLSPKPEHAQRRRSTGIMSPIPCQLSLFQVPNSNKAGPSRRRLSLEVPVIPEIRNLLEKQKGLLTTQSKDSLEEPKKGREKRRASFSEAEPIIINDVLARQRCLSPRDERTIDSGLDNGKNRDMPSGCQNTPAEQILISIDTAFIETNGSEETSNAACVENHTSKLFKQEKDQLSSNLDPHKRDFIEHKDDTLVYKTHAIQQNNNTYIHVNGMCESRAMRSIDSSPRSAKSAFISASKRHVENRPSSCNGYFSETDAEEFPVTVNPNLKPCPISSVARYLEAVTNCLEGEGDTSMSNNVSTNIDSMSPPTLEFSDHNPALSDSVNSLQGKVKTEMTSRAVEVNNSTCSYTTLNTRDNNSHFYSSEYYYACDKSTQCSLTGPGNKTPPHMMTTSISTSTQTGVCKHEVSSQTTDVFYFVNSSLKIASLKDRTESKGVNTVVCLIGREHGDNYLKRSTNYTTANFNRIDETIREIDAELSNIDIRNYQRSRGINSVQSTERSYPSFPLQGLTDSTYHRVSSNYYQHQAQSHETRQGTHKLALKRCVPSNWHDATELTNTSHSDDNTCDRIMGDRRGFRDNERKITVNDYKVEKNVSRIPDAATVTSNAGSSTDFSCTDTDCEEDKQVCIQHASTRLQSSGFYKSNQSSTEGSYRVSVKNDTLHDTDKPYTAGDGNHKNLPAIEIINPLQRPTYTSHAENKNESFGNTLKSTNEPTEDIGIEFTASDSKGITLQAMNSCGEKAINTQSHACADEHQPVLDVIASSNDLSSPRNSCPRQKLVNTKHMIRIDSCESPQFPRALIGKEKTDKGHSKLSRLKYNQSSHRSSGSSFDIELDFMNAGDPVGTFKCSDSISQAMQDSKRHMKKQNHVQEILDPAQLDKVIQHDNIISGSNTGALAHLNMPANVSHKTRPDEQSWSELSSTSKETLVMSPGLKGETQSDSRITETVKHILTDTDHVACYSLAADATFSREKPLVTNISKTKLETSDRVKGIPENMMALNSVNTDCLQLHGSPDHLFNRARYASLSRISTPSTSSVTSARTHTQEHVAMHVEDNNLSVMEVAAKNQVSPDRSEGVDVLSAVQQLDDIREDNETKTMLSNVSDTSVKTCRSVEKSCDEYSDASVYPMLSTNSVLAGNHKENNVTNEQGKGNNVANLDKDEVGSFHVITGIPPVLDPAVFKISHIVRRCQSAGDWPPIDGVQESCDVDSNKSLVGSELNHDTDDMDIMEIESRKQRSNSESSYSEPLLDLSDSLSQGSDSTHNIKKDVIKTNLLATGYNTDDFLQVSDFGAFSPTSFQRKSPAGENLSLSPSNSIRSQERRKHSPSCTPLRSPSREFPPEPIQCNDSDDELDSETELKIRERLRQVRRESRRNSKDNWDAIQSVLLAQNQASDDSPPNQEEITCNRVQHYDSAVSIASPTVVTPIEEKNCPLDISSADECDQEISRINLNRPVTRKLVKMSSDPVDKDMYCRSVPSLSAKEKTSQRTQNSPVVEEHLTDFENGGESCSVHVPEAVMEMDPLSDVTNHSISDNMGESLTDLKLLDNNSKAFGETEIQNQVEESCSLINDQTDLNANSDNMKDNTSAARILEVEFINDEVDQDAFLITDRQDSLQESSTNILDELEIIALFKKIDGYEGSVNPCVDYSSESTSSVEFKLSEISEEDTQSEDNTNDGSQRHIWQVRSRFVLPQDTLESTLDGVARPESVSSRSSYHSDNTDSLPNVEETIISEPNEVKPIHKSYINENAVTHNQHMNESTGDIKTEATSDAKIETTNDTQNELQHDGGELNSFLTYLYPSNKDVSADVELVLSHPRDCQLKHHQQKNGFLDYGNSDIPNSLTSNDTYSKLTDCDNSKTKARSPKETSAFCDVFPTEKGTPAYETQTFEWKTDVTGKISTKLTNTHILKRVHLNSNFNNLHYTNGHKDSATGVPEVRKHTSTMQVLVGDHRKKHSPDQNQPQQLSDQLSAKWQANLEPVSNGKYSTDIEDILAANALLYLCGNSSAQKVTDNTVEQEHRLETHDTFSEAFNQKEVGIGKDIADNVSPHILNDSAVFDMYHNNNSTTLLQTQNQTSERSTQNDLKNKVRSMFLIDRITTSRDTVHDTNIDIYHNNSTTLLQTQNQNSELSTQNDLKNKVRSMFLIDRITTSRDTVHDTNIDIYHNNSTTLLQTQNQNSELSTQNDLKNKVRSMFLIDRITTSRDTVQDTNIVDDSCISRTREDSKDTNQAIIDEWDGDTTYEDTLRNGWSTHNNDSMVQDYLTGRKENLPTEIKEANVESNLWDSTELCNTGCKFGKSKMPEDVSQTFMSAYFSEAVDSDDLFEDASGFIDLDYRLNESTTQKLVESNISFDQLSLNSRSEDILTDNANYNSDDCESRISLPQVHLNEVTSSLVPIEDNMWKNAFKEMTRNNIESDNSLNSININTHNLSGDFCATDDFFSVSEFKSVLPVSERDISGTEKHNNNNNAVPRSLNEDESSCEGNTFNGNNRDTLNSNSKIVGLGDSTAISIHEAGHVADNKTISIYEAGHVDDNKTRVRAMFLLSRHSDSNSSDPKPDNPAPCRESSPPSPLKRCVNVSTILFENREHSPTSFVTSSLAAGGDAQREELGDEGEPLNNGILINSRIPIHDTEMKTMPSGVNRRANKSFRVLKFRNSLLRLHEQMNVFSSIGSDSDSEMTSALKNQGDYDIRMRDLALGRISSENNDEEDTGASADPRQCDGIAVDKVSDSASVQEASNVAGRDWHSLEDSECSSSADTLVNSSSNSVECDVTGDLSGTGSILTPKVLIQQPSEEQLLLTNTVTSSTSATMTQHSAVCIPVPSDTKENVNYTENRFIPGERRHYSKRFSARPGSSWLRNNPDANLLTPERALTHALQYNHAVNHSPYTRILDDSHPELSYLDIVSKLKQEEVYKAKPAKKSDVELVITPPDAQNRHSKKGVRFILSENIPTKMSSQHTEDKNSKDVH